MKKDSSIVFEDGTRVIHPGAKDGMTAHDLKVGDTFYIRKLKSDYPCIYECRFEGLRKGNVVGTVLRYEQDFLKYYYKIGAEITAKPKSCFVWGMWMDTHWGGERPICFWLNEKKLKKEE